MVATCLQRRRKGGDVADFLGRIMGEIWFATECEDFDEALSRVKQRGSLRDYQKEFERFGNQVQG